MPVNGKSRRSYRGAPVSNTLGVTLSAAATNITLAVAVSGWSTDAEPFFVVVDPGTAKEEKICVKYSSSTTLTVVDPTVASTWGASAAGRGADGTTDRQHEQGAVIYPVFTALEANQANELVSKYANAGSVVYQGSGALGTATFTELVVGTAGQALKVNAGATAPEWGQIPTAGIADSAITLAKLATALQAYLVPVGSINAYPAASAPAGWLLCDGSAFSSATYPVLYGLLGNVATTPDFQGHTLVGKSASAPFNGALLSKFGSTTSTAPHTHNLGSHTHTFSGTSGAMSQNSTPSHTVNDPGHVHTVNGQEALTWSSADFLTGVLESAFGGNAYTESTASASTGITVSAHNIAHDHTFSGTTSGPSADSGASSASATHGNVQPSAIINYIIKHD